MKPTAALFSTNFLEYSQTFVHDELRSHQRWQVEVFCAKRLNPQRFDWPAVHVAGPQYSLSMCSPSFDRAFKSGRFSLVHGHFGPGSLYAMRYAKRYGLPLLCTFHGYDVPLLRSDRRLRPAHWRYALLAPMLLRNISLALCASTELREMVVEYGVADDRAVVHRLGVDLERFKPIDRAPNPRPQLIQIGRFVEKKAYPTTLRALHQLLQRGQDAQLTIIGSGSAAEREPIESLVRSLGLQDHVHFAGILSAQEVATRLANADLLLCPSATAADGDRESGVIVIKEAAACGVPCVATWHGGIPEIVDDGVTGFLVPERDSEALAERIERLLLNPERRREMGRAARKKIETEYDLRDAGERLESLYELAVERHRRTRSA
ncbi:MAG: glycosyltransferase [Myxococcota bacterium]|jgi:glycosyltransferase involved in cell wall biosynthesis|nr:glycosyltransferase [Myxococcota bacterium]